MTYNKPEIAVLGDASRVIQGTKQGLPVEPNQSAHNSSFELDD